MTAVRMSKRFTVPIPERIRKRMKLGAGRKFQVLQFENRIELIPVEPIEDLRGTLEGIDTTIERDEDRT